MPGREMGSDQTPGASCFETYGNIIDSARRVRINTRKKTKGRASSRTGDTDQ